MSRAGIINSDRVVAVSTSHERLLAPSGLTQVHTHGSIVSGHEQSRPRALRATEERGVPGLASVRPVSPPLQQQQLLIRARSPRRPIGHAATISAPHMVRRAS